LGPEKGEKASALLEKNRKIHMEKFLRKGQGIKKGGIRITGHQAPQRSKDKKAHGRGKNLPVKGRKKRGERGRDKSPINKQ